MDFASLTPIITAAMIPLCTLITYLVTRYDGKKEKKDEQREEIRCHAKGISKLEKSFEDMKAESALEKQMVHTMLKHEVILAKDSAMKYGEITSNELAFITESVELLHKDGENGQMTAALQAVQSLPIV